MSKRKTGRTPAKSKSENVSSETSFAQDQSNLRMDQLIELTYGSLKTYTDKFTWKNIHEAICIAMNYARGGSELIQAAIMLKIEFFGAGFRLKVNTGRPNMNESANKRVADWVQKHDIRQLCDDLLFDLMAADNCIVMWQVGKSGEVDFITTLPPDTIDCLPGNTDTQVGVRMTPELRGEILKSIAAGKQSQWAPKFVDAVKDGTPVVWLKESDGEFWVMKSRGPKFAGLRQPSMRSIFADIQLRELLISGDWSTAYFTKNFVTLITMGESIKQGPRAGSRDLYPSRDEILAVQAQFKKIGTTMRLYGNHTLNVRHVYPDQNVLGNDKYEGVERRITRWNRVPDVMMTGQGDGYSQGTLGQRSFETQGERVREILSELFVEMMTHETIMDDPTLKLPSKATVKCTFNKQVLKDPAQVLKELTYLNDNGALDIETMHEDLGRDYDEIKARKTRDKEETKDPKTSIWVPAFEKAQGMLTPQDGGADGGAPTKPGADKKTDGPRPSRNE